MKFKFAIRKYFFIFLLVIFTFSLSACSFKAKTVAQDSNLDTNLLKRKATVAGPPNKEATQSANNPVTNPTINPLGPELQEASDSNEASDSADTEENEQQAKDLALNHVFQMEEYKDGRGENLTATNVTKQDCETCYSVEVEFDLTDQTLSEENKKVSVKVDLENWEIKNLDSNETDDAS